MGEEGQQIWSLFWMWQTLIEAWIKGVSGDHFGALGGMGGSLQPYMDLCIRLQVQVFLT